MADAVCPAAAVGFFERDLSARSIELPELGVDRGEPCLKRGSRRRAGFGVALGAPHGGLQLMELGLVRGRRGTVCVGPRQAKEDVQEHLGLAVGGVLAEQDTHLVATDQQRMKLRRPSMLREDAFVAFPAGQLLPRRHGTEVQAAEHERGHHLLERSMRRERHRRPTGDGQAAADVGAVELPFDAKRLARDEPLKRNPVDPRQHLGGEIRRPRADEAPADEPQDAALADEVGFGGNRSDAGLEVPREVDGLLRLPFKPLRAGERQSRDLQ